MNSLATQPSERDTEYFEFKSVPKEREKQVIFNNYYISDIENGWTQLAVGKIPPNISGNRTQGKSSKISPNKTPLEHSSEQPKMNKEEKSLNIDQERRTMTHTITEPM